MNTLKKNRMAEKNKNEEIEIKIKLNQQNLNYLKQWLKENARYNGESPQEDHYFDNPENSWFKIHEEGYKYALQYLRVRISPSGNSICFKNWDTNNQSTGSMGLYCQDYEVPISDPHNHIKLLESIGFTDRTTIKKTRQSYLYEVFEIAIDTAKGIGTFVEFEIKNRMHNSANLEYKRVLKFIKDIGLRDFKIQKQGFIILAWNPDFNFT